MCASQGQGQFSPTVTKSALRIRMHVLFIYVTQILHGASFLKILTFLDTFYVLCIVCYGVVEWFAMPVVVDKYAVSVLYFKN